MPEAQTHSHRLEEECQIFCKYLIDQKPDRYVLQKYRDGHSISSLRQNSSAGRFDTTLIKIAKLNTFAAKAVDAYTRMFYNRALIRKKLVLLLAILESRAPSHSYFDSADSCAKPVLFTRLLQNLVVFAMSLLFSAIILVPLHLAFGRNPKGRG